MPISRTLTKQFQKLNVGSRKSRSNSNATSPSDRATTTPNGDYFYSISFEQTEPASSYSNSDDERSSIRSSTSTDASSHTDGASREPVTPSAGAVDNSIHTQILSRGSRSPSLEYEYTLAKEVSTTAPERRLRAATSPSTSPLSPPPPMPAVQQSYPQPKSQQQQQQQYHKHTDSSSTSSVYSSSLTMNSPTMTHEALFVEEATGAIGTVVTDDHQAIEEEKLAPEELKKLQEDAKADEMAMHILEKVSADDYVREIKTGSWCI